MEYQAKENEIAEDIDAYCQGAFVDIDKWYFGGYLVNNAQQGYPNEQTYHEAYCG